MTTIQEFLVTQGITSAKSEIGKTSTDAAIMAVPYGLDPIRLVGDVDKHATILHFGETSTLPSDAKDILLDILVQVAKNSSPFRERIINVSRLGSDNPPALVALLSNRFLDQIRNSLQVSPQVRDYLTNMQQFLQYTPHVTLGYPDYQGETELRKMVSPLGQIQFDRLSLWWNGEHFDVPLMNTGPDENCEPSEAGWGEDAVSNFLAHYGVKGMKWKDVNAHPEEAVQNAGNGNAPAAASFHNSILRPKPGQVAHDPKAPKADVDWAQKKATAANLSKVANKSHNEFQGKFRELLKSPRFQEVAALIKARKNDPASAQNPKVIAFFKQAKKIHDDIWAKNSEETFGQSPSKGYKLIAVRHPDGTVTSQMVKTKPTFSKPGKSLPTDATKGPRKMQHDDILKNFIMHVKTDFDESKVKRDGDGQFTRKADAAGIPTDEAWLADKKNVVVGVYDKSMVELATMAKAVVKANGLPFETDLDKHPKVLAEVMTKMVPILNKHAETSGVSPSGTQRMGFFVNKQKTKVYSKAVPYKAPAAPVAKKTPAVAPRKTTAPEVNKAKIVDTGIHGLPEHRDGGLFNPAADITGGHVVDRPPESTSILDTINKMLLATATITHEERVDNFLAHFGIKGMRWGIRRERGPGGTVESGVKLHEDNSFEIPSLHKMPVGSVAAIHTGEAAPKLMKKREDGRWEETHLSADAERFAKTRSKAQHELSDREINEATKRAEAIKKYNELFNPPHNPNKELADKVAAMELQLRYAKAHSELHPSFGTRVSKFIKANEKTFKSVAETLAGPTGVKMAAYMKRALDPGIQAVNNASTTTHPKQSTTAGTSVAKQTATLPFSGNGAHSNPSHGAPPPKRSILRRKPKPGPFI